MTGPGVSRSLGLLLAYVLAACHANPAPARPAPPRPGGFPAVATAATPPVLPSVPPAPTPTNEYRVGAGDVLDVTVLGNNDLSRTATVQPSGEITLPLLNEVPVAGLTVTEVQQKVTNLLARDYLVNPQVEVRVKEYQSQFVLVLGEVNAPGRKVLRGSARLVDILVDAGGLNTRSSGDVVITRSDGAFAGGVKSIRVRLVGQFNVQDYVNLEIPLRNGDVVTVLPRSYVTVEGEVQRPGRYPIEGDLTVTGAVSMAGGLTRFGSNNVKLRRIDPSTGQVTITTVDLKAVRKGRKTDPAVSANDVISVPRRLF